MLNCKIAMDEEAPCGMTICCHYCPNEDCDYRCKADHTTCSDGIEIESELDIINSNCPDVMQKVTEIVIQMKKFEEEKKQLTKTILEVMERNGIKKFENDKLSFTYVAPSTRTTIDSARLKKEKPDVAAEYSKTSNVSASVTIKLK